MALQVDANAQGNGQKRLDAKDATDAPRNMVVQCVQDVEDDCAFISRIFMMMTVHAS